MDKTVLLEVRDRTAYVTMNRTEKLKAINNEMLGTCLKPAPDGRFAPGTTCPPGPGLWTWMFLPMEKLPAWNNCKLEKGFAGNDGTAGSSNGPIAVLVIDGSVDPCISQTPMQQ